MIDSPSTVDEFESALTEIKRSVRSLRTGYRDDLFNFSNRFVESPDLQGDLLILLQRLHSGDNAQQLRLVDEVIVLLDKINEDYNPQATAEFHEQLAQTELVSKESFAQKQDVAVRCSGLEKQFTGFTLGPIDFEIRRGEIAGVVGENGNGKTTFFRVLVGELLQDKGSIAYPFLKQEGHKIDWHQVKSNIAYVPQELPKWHGSLRENLEYEAAIHGIRGKENERSVNYIVERLRLAQHMGKSWQKLSGGYRFRFALARALVWKPCLMVLDEPLANLDPRAQLIVLRDLQDLARSVSHPIAILFSSQHIEEVEAVSDRLLFLRDGNVKFNDLTSRIGLSRTSNAFLLDVELSLSELRAAFPREMGVSISWDGLEYVLSTDLGLKAEQVLRPLLDHGVRVRSFRDISCSTKRLFQDIAD